MTKEEGAEVIKKEIGGTVVEGDCILFADRKPVMVVRVHPKNRFEIKNLGDCTCTVVHSVKEVNKVVGES